MSRAGLGYVGVDMATGVELRMDRLYESRGELTGELVVQRAPEGHLTIQRLNLTSMTTRKSTAKALSEDERGKNVNWSLLLEQFCLRVLELDRAGSPVVMVGDRPRRPEPPYLLKPLLLEGSATILFGTGGTGKSSLAAAVAVSLETGVSAFRGWDVRKRTKVLVLDWEATEDDWNDMVASVAAGMEIKAPQIAYIRMSAPLDTQVHQLASIVTLGGYGAVIVDSVTWAMRSQREGGGIDEPVKRMFDALRQIGATSFLIDHMSKAAAQAQDEMGGMPIGSIVKGNKARATYELRKASEPDADGTQHLALINRKSNPAKPEPTIGIQVRRSPTGALVLLEEEALIADPVVAHAVSLSDRIRTALRKGNRMTAAQIVGAIGLGGSQPEATVRKTMERHPGLYARDPRTSPQEWFLIDIEHERDNERDMSRSVSQEGERDSFNLVSQPVSPGSGDTWGGTTYTPPKSVPLTSSSQKPKNQQDMSRSEEGRWDGLMRVAEERAGSVEEEAAE